LVDSELKRTKALGPIVLGRVELSHGTNDARRGTGRWANKSNAAIMQYKDVQFSLLMGIVRGQWRIVIRWPNGTALDRSFRGGKTDAVRGVEGIIDRWLTEHGKKRRLLASVE